MVISTCGFGNTGASAVLDFLKEYDTISVQGSLEFQLIHMPDGLLDLKHQLVWNGDRVSSNVAIQRFINLDKSMLAYRLHSMGCDFKKLSEEFISELKPIIWKGCSNYDTYDISNVNHTGFTGMTQRIKNGLLRRISPNVQSGFEKRFFLMVDEATYDRIAGNFIKKIFSAIKVNLENDIVMDMLFSAVTPNAGMEFFDIAKAIVVYRDPVDLYLRASMHRNTNGFLPCNDVKLFTRYYKTLMDRTVIGENVLCVQYESLIYDYYNTTKNIMDFLELKTRPQKEFYYFNPDISVKYTRADLTYPGYDDEIRYIKRHLSSYLFDFPDKYIPVRS